MKEITKKMVNEFGIMTKGYDFMGYQVDGERHLSFHHLIVPKRMCKATGLGDGYIRWNGAILVQNTSHDYLHRIEIIDRDVFKDITRYMIDENELGRLDIQSLKKIRSALLYFENEHEGKTMPNGNQIVKRRFLTKRYKF